MMKGIAVAIILTGNLLVLAAFPKLAVPTMSAAPLCGRVLPSRAAPDTTLPRRYLLLMLSLGIVDGGVLLLYVTLQRGTPAKA